MSATANRPKLSTLIFFFRTKNVKKPAKGTAIDPLVPDIIIPYKPNMPTVIKKILENPFLAME